MIDMVETVIISTLLAPAKGETVNRVRSTYVNDLTNPTTPKPLMVTIIDRYDPISPESFPPIGLERHEVPVSIGETRVKVTHLERAETPKVPA